MARQQSRGPSPDSQAHAVLRAATALWRGNQGAIHQDRTPRGIGTDGDFGVDDIRDENLKVALQTITKDKEGKEFAAAIAKFSAQDVIGVQRNIYRGLRHVRIAETLEVIPIRDKAGKAYKGYKGDSNYRFDVWRLKDGRWKAEIVSMFEAHQPGFTSELRYANPTAKKLLSLQQNDVVVITEQGQCRYLRVVKFSGGSIVFAALNEAGALKARDANPNDPFKYISKSASALKEIQARQVRVDEIGRVWDPGPRS